MADEKTGETPPRQKGHPSGRPLGVLLVCVVLGILVIVLGLKGHRLSTAAADLRAQLTQSQSDAARGQSDLDSAKVAAAQLQSQLDQARNQLYDRQSQLDKSKVQATGLQSRLDGAKDQLTALQSEMDGSKARLADAQAKLSRANDESTALKTKLDQAKSRSMDLQSRLQKAEGDLAKLQPVAQKVRQMPITTSFEKAFLGRSLTLRVKNLNPGPLKVDITVNGLGKSRLQSGTIGSGESAAVDELAAGQTVVVASEDYDPVTLTVP